MDLPLKGFCYWTVIYHIVLAPHQCILEIRQLQDPILLEMCNHIDEFLDISPPSSSSSQIPPKTLTHFPDLELANLEPSHPLGVRYS